MADKTSIEWTRGDDGTPGATWNPVTGCTEVSPGCDHCYAKTFAERWRGTPGHHFEQGFDVVLRPERLDQPLRWKKPRRVFVNSMSDLFHDAIPDEYVARVFAAMAMAPQHTFQCLTKRHGRMRSLLRSEAFWRQVGEAGRSYAIDRAYGAYPSSGPMELAPGSSARGHWEAANPLPNVWLGVSVEDQKWADIRIPALLDTPAAVRWISAEPLLGPVRLADGWLTQLRSVRTGIDWLVVGGESGPAARPMHPDWARGLRDQCTSASVPYFFKQHGEWQPIGPLYGDDDEADDARMDAVGWEVEARKKVVQLESTGHIAEGHQPTDPRTWLMVRRGKKAAGRELDGRTWDEYPG